MHWPQKIAGVYFLGKLVEIMLTTNIKFNVVGPTGGFINHIRWLILLDPMFSFNLHTDNLEKYNEIKGTNWPSYQDYVDKNLTQVPDSAKNEMYDMDSYLLEFDNMETKLNSITHKIYPESRTWHNWLIFEWRYRHRLGDFVGVCNGREIDKISPTDTKHMLITIEPELAYRCYLKFNSSLNLGTADWFKQDVKDHIKKYQNLNLQYSKIIASDILYSSVLDKNFYNELIRWFDLEDNYNQASYVHQLWFKAHLRAEKEFVNDIREIYENRNK